MTSRRNKRWEYTPPPKARGRNDPINAPNGTPEFCRFPAISVQGVCDFPQGSVYLRYGEHRGPHAGFGFMHIWRERFTAIQTEQDAEKAVVRFVAGILCPGAAIHYEGGATANERALIFVASSGLAVVEQRFDQKNNAFYSVVTAYEAKKANGPLVGAV